MNTFDVQQTERLIRADMIAAAHQAEMARMALARVFVRLRDAGDPQAKSVAAALQCRSGAGRDADAMNADLLHATVV